MIGHHGRLDLGVQLITKPFALDVLAARKVDPETIREAIGERDRPGDAAVLQEAMNRLRM